MQNGNSASPKVWDVTLPQPTRPGNLPPVHTLEIDSPDERARTLRQLLADGHAAIAPLRHPNLQFHSHLPHLLGSGYFLGASTQLLKELYDKETATLLPIDDTFIRGDDLSGKNWREQLNNKPYTVAYVDYFDQEVKKNGGDWAKVLQEYLYDDPAPIINGFVGGLGHPFIHLAYAYECRDSGVATEALSLGCTERDPFHDWLDNQPQPDTSTYKTASLADVITKVYHDKRFDGLLQHPGFANVFYLREIRLDVFHEHWSAFRVDNPDQQLEDLIDFSVLLAIGTAGRATSYDFFLIHLMTVAHALRVLWKDIPKERHTTILKEYAIFVIYIYINQLRRPINASAIHSYDLKGRDWNWVVERALQHPDRMDSHFFKVVRAPKAFAETFGEKGGFYLKATVKFLDEYEAWTGFGLGTDGFDPANPDE